MTETTPKCISESKYMYNVACINNEMNKNLYHNHHIISNDNIMIIYVIVVRICIWNRRLSLFSTLPCAALVTTVNFFIML